MAQGKVTQISQNKIVDNELRDALDKKIEEIGEQIEFLTVISKAIGEMLICICYVIEKSDSYDESKTIEKIFKATTGPGALNGPYSMAYNNFASIILQLCGNKISSNYRKGISGGSTMPLTQNIINNAKAVCATQNTQTYYYGASFVPSGDGSISNAVENKGMYKNIGNISPMDSTAKKQEESNIF